MRDLLIDRWTVDPYVRVVWSASTQSDLSRDQKSVDLCVRVILACLHLIFWSYLIRFLRDIFLDQNESYRDPKNGEVESRWAKKEKV